MSTVKVNGQQRKIVDAYAKINGQWRKSNEMYNKVSGQWRGSYTSNFATPSFVTLPSQITRGETITWNVENIAGAHYEYERRYNEGTWGARLIFEQNSGQVTVSTSTANNSLQIRVRAVAPTTHDKESNWVYSPVVSLTAQKLSTPTGLTYPNSITRGQDVTITWNTQANVTYQMQSVYRNDDGTTSFFNSYSGTAGSHVHTASALTYRKVIWYRVKASRTGFFDSDWAVGPEITLLNQKLATVGSLSAPKPHQGQSITVSWGSVTNAQRYRLEVQINDGTWTNVYWNSNRSYTYTTPTNATKIRWRVRATATNYADSDWTYTTATAVDLPPLKTTTWDATSVGSWRPNFGGQYHPDNRVYQGAWNDGTLWGPYTGMAFFNSSSIRNTLAGKTIERVRIYFYRINAGGIVAGQTINLHTHNYDSRPTASAGRPTMVHIQGPFSSFARGEGKWVTVNKTIGERLRDNTAKGIGLYTSDTSGTGYLFMSDNVKIEIQYR